MSASPTPTSPIVLALDADNRLLPEAPSACGRRSAGDGAAYAFPHDPPVRGHGSGHDEHPLGLTPYDPGRFRNSNYIDAMALVRRASWAAVGGYDHLRYGWEDYDFWLQLGGARRVR